MATHVFNLSLREKVEKKRNFKNEFFPWHFIKFLHLNIWKAYCDSNNQTDKAADCTQYHKKIYMGTKNTTLILKSSIQCLFSLALKIEREIAFILKTHCTPHTLENNSFKERKMQYMKREQLQNQILIADPG